MKETGVLAIARRVTSNDRGLRLGILYPLVEEIESDENGEPVFKEVTEHTLLYLTLLIFISDRSDVG